MSRASRSSSSAISARYFFASSRARSLNAGDILSRRFLKFFAISCSCDSENTPIVVGQYPSSAGQTDHLLQAQSAHTTLDRQSCLRQSGESPCASGQKNREHATAARPPCHAIPSCWNAESCNFVSRHLSASQVVDPRSNPTSVLLLNCDKFPEN